MLADKLGIEIASLGAFTSIAVRDGFDLLDKISIGITTGNVYSALVEVQNAKKAANLIGLDMAKASVAIVGAAGSVGSGCARYLMGSVKRLILVDINFKTLNGLFPSSREKDTEINNSSRIEDIRHADIVIVVTSSLTA